MAGYLQGIRPTMLAIRLSVDGLLQYRGWIREEWVSSAVRTSDLAIAVDVVAVDQEIARRIASGELAA